MDLLDHCRGIRKALHFMEDNHRPIIGIRLRMHTNNYSKRIIDLNNKHKLNGKEARI